MKVVKEKTDGDIGIHFDPNDTGFYVQSARGIAKWGQYGSTYISFTPELAVKIAKEIIAKCPEAK